MPEGGESSGGDGGGAKPKFCEEDKHSWKEDSSRPGTDAASAKAQKQAEVDKLKNSPSRAGEMRGADAEKRAIEHNEKMHPIDSCGKHYVCAVCGKEQETDLEADGRVIETKSINVKSYRTKGAQRKRLRGIQKQMKDPTKKPLAAKVDQSLPDAKEVEQKFRDSGFEVEPVPAPPSGP